MDNVRELTVEEIEMVSGGCTNLIAPPILSGPGTVTDIAVMTFPPGVSGTLSAQAQVP
jgi:hypothetical protein